MYHSPESFINAVITSSYNDTILLFHDSKNTTIISKREHNGIVVNNITSKPSVCILGFLPIYTVACPWVCTNLLYVLATET